MSALSVTGLITYATAPTSLCFLALFFPLSKLYVNAFLASLNSRTWDAAGMDNVKVPLNNVGGDLVIPVAFTEPPPPDVEIRVEHEIVKS